MKATIGKNYKLIIPKPVGKGIDLKPGDEVKLEIQGQLVYITTTNKAPCEPKRQSGAAWAQALRELYDNHAGLKAK